MINSAAPLEPLYGSFPPQGIRLAVAIGPLNIVIAFIAGDKDNRARKVCRANGLQDATCPHDIDLEGLERVRVGFRDQRLGGQVKDKIGSYLRDQFANCLVISYIQDVVIDDSTELRRFKM